MAYSKAAMKSNSEQASPILKPFLIGNTLEKRLPTRTVLEVAFRHILLALLVSRDANILQDLPPK